MGNPSILLISGSGLLGTVLVRELPRLGVPCLATSRRDLDLERPVEGQLAPLLERGPFTHAVLTAAISGVDDCFRNPERSHRVNVEAPRELFAVLAGAGIKPVFFSTDLVFDCASDLRREDDPIGPLTLYARQKAEAEASLRELSPDFLIFRTSKLMTMDLSPRSILAPIVEAGRGGKAYRAFRDQFITPVFAEDVARAISVAAERALSGTFHLAGAERFSRLELAQRVARELGFEPGAILDSSMRDAAFSEPRGPFNTLSSEKFRQAAGFRFTPLSEGLKALRLRL